MEQAITAFGNIPALHLLFLTFVILVLIYVFWTSGINLKIGEKEIHLGGINRQLASRDKDQKIREDLKKQTDDIDHEVSARLEDLIDDMDYEMGGLFSDSGKV